jgi:hypothetical protein
MTETEPTPATAHSEPEPKTKPKPKAAPVRSLVELYTHPGANPTKLLVELEKSPSWQFDAEDAEAALAVLAKADPQLKKTRALLHEAIARSEGRFMRTAAEFVLRATAEDLAGAAGWPPDDGAPAREALAAATSALAPVLHEPKRARRAHNVLMIVVDLLSARHGLSIEEATPVLKGAVGAPSAYGRRRSNPRRHRVATLVDAATDVERLRGLLDLQQPLEATLHEASDAARAAVEARERAEREAAEAKERTASLQARISALEADLDRARQETQALSDQARDVQIVAGSDVAELRARATAFLNTRLRDLVATAHEASQLDPPRAETAARLLEQALKEIRQEVEWLRSSV